MHFPLAAVLNALSFFWEENNVFHLFRSKEVFLIINLECFPSLAVNGIEVLKEWAEVESDEAEKDKF